MITVEEALALVTSKPGNYGTELVTIPGVLNRFLAEDVFADRDSPPYDRVMMDGIAINSKALQTGATEFLIEGVQAAGDAQKTLQRVENCIEVMTGAIVPGNTDTIVPYEQIDITDGRACMKPGTVIKKHIHIKGSDHKKGTLALAKGKRLTAADAGLLASVGMAEVPVCKLPKTAIIATGNELVPVEQVPLEHQVRMSNVYALQVALQADGIGADIFHIVDDEEGLYTQLSVIIAAYDAVLISGGVSKGKYDFVPAVLEKIGVHKLFHQVAQRPGKPFWFGYHAANGTVVFAFPGNPISTFVCHQYYFRQWLCRSFGNSATQPMVQLSDEISGSAGLSLFIPVSINSNDGGVTEIKNNGSGDLFSLAGTDGFIYLTKDEKLYPKQSVFPFLKAR